MSTVLIVVIVVVVLIVVALLVSAANRRKQTHQIAEAQVTAKHDDVDHHREQARDARAEGELAAERAKRAAAEADPSEHQPREDENVVGHAAPTAVGAWAATARDARSTPSPNVRASAPASDAR